MIKEKQKPSLIPKLDQTLEEARDGHFGGNWPPRTNGDLPGYHPSPAVVRESKAQAEKVKSTRRLERSRLRKAVAYGAVLVTAAGLTVATTELANAMGNEEHAPWDKPVPAHVSHR